MVVKISTSKSAPSWSASSPRFFLSKGLRSSSRLVLLLSFSELVKKSEKRQSSQNLCLCPACVDACTNRRVSPAFSAGLQCYSILLVLVLSANGSVPQKYRSLSLTRCVEVYSVDLFVSNAVKAHGGRGCRASKLFKKRVYDADRVSWKAEAPVSQLHRWCVSFEHSRSPPQNMKYMTLRRERTGRQLIS